MVYTLRDSLHYFFIIRSRLVEQIKKGPISLAADGSNDEGLLKLNPLLVRLFDYDLGYVQVQLLGLCYAKSGTAEILFENISNALRSNSSCVGLSLDNTSVNLGQHNKGEEGQRVLQIFQKNFVAQETIDLNILCSSSFSEKYFMIPPISFSFLFKAYF